MIVRAHGPTLCVFVSWTESNKENVYYSSQQDTSCETLITSYKI